ncbi:hypothetical protein F6Q10_33725, partial [Streptomyces vinaceus]|nr:hypothetical protein [Streptomyces vinaceus]
LETTDPVARLKLATQQLRDHLAEQDVAETIAKDVQEGVVPQRGGRVGRAGCRPQDWRGRAPWGGGDLESLSPAGRCGGSDRGDAGATGASRCRRRCRPRGVPPAGLAGPGALGWWGGLESLVPAGRCGWVRPRRRRVRPGVPVQAALSAARGVARSTCRRPPAGRGGAGQRVGALSPGPGSP